MHTLLATRRRKLAGSAIALVAAAALAACGTAPRSAAEVPQNVRDQQVAAAKAALAEHAAAPTRIGMTTPLVRKPDPGKTIVRLTNPAPQEKLVTDGIVAAAAAIGWDVRTLTYDFNNPATFHAAMRQALQYRPAAVMFTTIPYELYKSDIEQYRAAGVPLVPVAVGPTPIDDTVIANINGPSDAQLPAEILANWVTADSGGDARILLAGVPDAPFQGAWLSAFGAAIEAACTGCSVTPFNRSVTQALAGGGADGIVSQLQRHQDVDYVVLDNIALANGLPQALDSAQLADRVKVVGAQMGKVDQSLLAQGREAAGTPISLTILGWLVVDVVARHTLGMPVTENGGGTPTQLLLPDTVGTPTDSYDMPTDYAAQFKKLWHVG